MIHKRTLLTVAVLALLVGGASAQTQWCFVAGLDGGEEVPPTPVPQTGIASLFLNTEQTQVSYYISYDPLPGETAAHFHQAPMGMNGPVIEPLPAGNPKVGVWNVTPEEVAALLAGEVYVNIHSTDYPGGAIRGQVTLCGVEDEPTAWGSIKSLYR